MRLSLGVGIKKVDGNDVGVRLPLFSYTGARLCTRKTINPEIDAEVKRVKALKNKTKEWVICNEQPGEYYSDDQLSILPGLGEKTETKLSKYGINNLGDLVEMSIDGIPEDLMKYCRENRILSKNIHEFVNHAKNAYVGSVPEDKDIDHQKARNPY